MRVLSLNFIDKDQTLVDDMRETFVAAGSQYVPLRAANCTIVLIDGVMTVYDQHEVVDLASDIAIVRGRGKHAHMTSLITRTLRHHKIPMVGSLSAGEFTHNDGKITQMVDLTLAKLPMPHSVIFSAVSYPAVPNIAATHGFAFPLVLKRTGSQGSCVWKVGSWDEVTAQVESTEAGELWLLQEYIPNTFDIRALYFHGELIGAMARTSNDGFYNNASKGAGVSQIELTPEEHELSLQACAVLNQGFAGVDIVRSERGPLFFEVNNRPGYDGFTRATGARVGKRIAEHILKQGKSS